MEPAQPGSLIAEPEQKYSSSQTSRERRPFAALNTNAQLASELLHGSKAHGEPEVQQFAGLKTDAGSSMVEGLPGKYPRGQCTRVSPLSSGLPAKGEL